MKVKRMALSICLKPIPRIVGMYHNVSKNGSHIVEKGSCLTKAWWLSPWWALNSSVHCTSIARKPEAFEAFVQRKRLCQKVQILMSRPLQGSFGRDRHHGTTALRKMWYRCDRRPKRNSDIQKYEKESSMWILFWNEQTARFLWSLVWRCLRTFI